MAAVAESQEPVVSADAEQSVADIDDIALDIPDTTITTSNGDHAADKPVAEVPEEVKNKEEERTPPQESAADDETPAQKEEQGDAKTTTTTTTTSTTSNGEAKALATVVVSDESATVPPTKEAKAQDEEEHKRMRESQGHNTGQNQQRNRAQQRASMPDTNKQRRQTLKRMKNPSKHKKIDKAHPEFELTYDMMLGIRTFVGRQTAQTIELTGDDFKEMHKHRFPGGGTNVTPPHHMRDFKFKDYCPKVFKALREMFNINPADYLLTLAGNFNYLEFISNSKSGSFFFYTHDRKFLIKTVTKEEGQFLRKILPAYYEHIKKYPNTLLNRYYGMHRVKPHKKKQIRFLVMASVFHTNLLIHRVFDLKGSSVGRNASAKEKKAQVPVLKDNDFLENKEHLLLEPEDAREFKTQIRREAEFLAQLNIMDYSLLVGIHDRKQARVAQTPLTRNSFMQTPNAASARNSFAISPTVETAVNTPAAVDPSLERVPAATPIVGHPIQHAQDQAEREASTNVDPANHELDVELKKLELEQAQRTSSAPPTSDAQGNLLVPGEQAHKALLTDKKRKKEEKRMAKTRRKELAVAAPKKYNLASTPHLSSPEFGVIEQTAHLRPGYATLKAMGAIVEEKKRDAAAAVEALSLKEEEEENDYVGSRFCRHYGGVQSSDGEHVYFMGVIDILQTYRTRKKLEHFIKGTYLDKKKISCVPPNQYAARFHRFMTEAVEAAEKTSREN